MQAVCVDPAAVHQIWPAVKNFIANAVEHCGDWSLSEIEDGINKGDFLLWLAWSGEEIQGAAITKLVELRQGEKSCCIIAMGGRNIYKWRHCIDDIENYATHENCKSVRIDGRQGLQKVFTDYRSPWCVLEKRLT